MAEPNPVSTGRFAPFTDEELIELWDGLTTDDGIRYGLQDGTVEAKLGQELHDEASRRGLTDSDDWRWAPPG
jgi:hypothetical protein